MKDIPMRMWSAVAALLMVSAGSVWAQGTPTVDGAWARATSASAQTGAAYLVVHGVAGDAVTGFSTPAAGSAMLHRSQSVGGVMEMRPVENLPLQAGQDVKLSPGGLHVMLMGLKHPLKAGDHFPLTVSFAHAAPVTVDVTVGRAGASGPAMGAMPGMKMP
jgi:copper(I)-binding protein